MIQKNKPSGYFVTSDPLSGIKIEGETRQCSHCQFTWIYRPGSGIKRGWCTPCNGLLCGQDSCMRYHVPQEIQLSAIEKGLTFENLIKSSRGAIILGRTEDRRE